MQTPIGRNLLHMGLLGWALLLPLLPTSYMLAAGFLGVLVAWWTAVFAANNQEEARVDWGRLTYPVSIVLLLLIFPRRVEIVAGAWAMTAVGDSTAAIVGRTFGGARWPYNPAKTITGSVAFAVAGTMAAVLIMLWVLAWQDRIETNQLVIATFAAALVTAVAAALLESCPLPLDDNLTVPLGSAALLWTMLNGTPALLFSGLTFWNVFWGVVLSSALVFIAYKINWLHLEGAICGLLISIPLIIFAGWDAYGVLLIAFIAYGLVLRYELPKKEAAGLVEQAALPAYAGQMLVNTSWALALAVFGAWTGHADWAGIGIAAVFATVLADSFASQFGGLYGGATRSPLTLEKSTPGTAGAISVNGTLSGFAGAALVAICAGFALTGWRWAPLVFVGSTFSFIAESYANAYWHRRISANTLDVLGTICAAVLSMALYAALAP